MILLCISGYSILYALIDKPLYVVYCIQKFTEDIIFLIPLYLGTVAV